MAWSSNYNTAARGVKKVSERILQEGRGFIYTEEEAGKLNWADIPVGSVMINTNTGMLYGKLEPTNVVVMKDGAILSPAMLNGFDNLVYIIKDNLLARSNDPATRLKGLKPAKYNTRIKGVLTEVQYKKSDINEKIHPQFDWVPLGIRDDGTICIAKDTIIKKETFTIKNVKYAPNEFTYENDAGKIRHGEIDSTGGYVFTLEKGHYAPGRNTLSVTIDGRFSPHTVDNGIREISEIRFAINQPLTNNMYIVVYYAMIFRIGNPYPRIFLGNEEPEEAEIGDFWLDYDADLDEEDYLSGVIKSGGMVDWNRISGKPTTISGYGIIDKISYEGHLHKSTNITDFTSAVRNIVANQNIQWTKVIGHPIV